MVGQRTEHSGTAHRAGLASSALGSARWWGVVGVLILGSGTAYLLPSFTDGRHATAGRLPDATDARPIASSGPSQDSVSLASFPSLAGEWQNLPLFASQDSPDVAADGAVKLLSFQVAYKRERERADAAQLQIAALQEQIATLREKREEVIVLREQLAELKANARQMAELRSAAIEVEERADDASLEAAASREELANLRAAIIEAQEAAESEKKKAASALEQLEVVQGQLAELTALEHDRAKTHSQMQPNQNQVAPAPLLENRDELLPGILIFQLSLPPEAYTPPADGQGNDAERNTQWKKGKAAANDRTRQDSLQSRTKALARLDEEASTPALSHRLRAEPETPRQSKLGKGTRDQSVRTVEKAAPRILQRRRLLAQDGHRLREPGVLSLPSALLPDSRLW